jgi:hypothetical protein
MPHPAAESFDRAAALITSDPKRHGNLLTFAPGDEIICAGDIHGNRVNLAKIITFANLAARPKRRVIFQEIIHGGPVDPAGGDRSYEMLLRAMRLKISFPDQVFFLLGNHDVAQFTGNEIAKEGRGECKAFDIGLDTAFGADAADVRAAILRALQCLPLAARCANGMFLTHSLPAPTRMGLVDWEILDRPYRPEDFRRGGTVYEWTWGRGHTAEQVAELAGRLQARQFILGHQPVKTGHAVQHGKVLILASDHEYGSILVFDSGKEIADDGLTVLVKKIMAL